MVVKGGGKCNDERGRSWQAGTGSQKRVSSAYVHLICLHKSDFAFFSRRQREKGFDPRESKQPFVFFMIVLKKKESGKGKLGKRCFALPRHLVTLFTQLRFHLYGTDG